LSIKSDEFIPPPEFLKFPELAPPPWRDVPWWTLIGLHFSNNNLCLSSLSIRIHCLSCLSIGLHCLSFYYDPSWIRGSRQNIRLIEIYVKTRFKVIFGKKILTIFWDLKPFWPKNFDNATRFWPILRLSISWIEF
jgi:hypothetical protein